MNMTQEMLEILIGKYLDGEITPSEQSMLEAELDRDAQAKELLRQLEDLHKRSCEVVASEIIGRGKTPEEVFEQAWQQQSKHSLRFIVKLGGHLRFTTGVAAGLLIGLALHFVLPSVSGPQGDQVPPDVFVQNIDSQANIERPDFPRLLTDPPGNVFRNVDLYSFTDKQGNQWLIEGLRENTVRPAAYDAGL